MTIDFATPGDIRKVALEMRERDLAEFSAIYPVDTREDLAELLAMRYGLRNDVLVARSGGEAVAIGAAMELRPNVLTAFFLATPRFPEIAFAITKFIKQRFFKPLVSAGAHRIEAMTLASYADMNRWLVALGMKREAEHRKFGKRGETFYTYAWTAGD